MAVPSILLVDDDTRLLEGLRDYLDAQGYVVYTATGGIEALATVKQFRPNLIILDVDMPQGDGLSALEELRGDHETTMIPVIMLTGVESARVYPVIEAMANVSHMKKPARPEDLLALIRHYIGEMPR